jgi:hypothetical protein
MPLVKKTYHCKVICLTNTKQVALQQEYDNLQHYLQTREDRGIVKSRESSYKNRFVNSIRQTQRVAKPREEGGKRKRKEI